MFIDLTKLLDCCGVTIAELSTLLGYSQYNTSNRVHATIEWTIGDLEKLEDLLKLDLVGLKNFSEEKLLFVDYDQTLVGHNYPVDYETSTDVYTDFLCQLTRPDIHAGDTIVPAVAEYISNAAKADDKIYILTHALSNLRDKVILDTVRKACPDVSDIELITVSQREYKIDMIRAIARSRNVPILNCTLIDDMQNTIREAATIGIKTLRTVSVCAQWEANRVEKD